MTSKWDAVIIGGGPAGSTTALYATEGGARVLIIDRRRAIGTPLQCGELLPTNAELGVLCPGVPDLDGLFQTPTEVISRCFNTLNFVAPNGHKLAFDFAGYSLDRPRHDALLAEQAIAAGAELRRGHVTSVEGDTVRLSDGSTVRGRVIVGAGGPHDPLRRGSWRTPPELSPVAMALVDGNFPAEVDMYFGSVAPGGYAWMIPKDGGANIGLGIRPGFNRSGQSLRALMTAFEGRLGGTVTYRGGGVVPVSGPLRELVRGRHLLVGDAAGMVMPSNGGGIPTAIIAGRIAGQAIAAHIADGAPLADYQREWQRQMGATMKYSLRALRFASFMFRRGDRFLNLGFNRLSRGFMRRAIMCRPMFGLY